MLKRAQQFFERLSILLVYTINKKRIERESKEQCRLYKS